MKNDKSETCPECGSKNYNIDREKTDSLVKHKMICSDCGSKIRDLPEIDREEWDEILGEVERVIESRKKKSLIVRLFLILLVSLVVPIVAFIILF